MAKHELPEDTRAKNLPADYDEEEDVEKLGLIKVKLGRRGERVEGKPGATKIFHEFDQNHPGGELLVTAGGPFAAYPTARVQRAIGEGLLKEVRDPRAQVEERPNLAEIIEERAKRDAVFGDVRQVILNLQSQVADLQSQLAARTPGNEDSGDVSRDQQAESVSATSKKATKVAQSGSGDDAGK